MRKRLLPCLFFWLPFALLAQDAPALYPDFYNGIKAANSIVLDDHINIMQVNTDNENFDVVAVNNQMQVLWRTSFAGYPFSISKFKGKIVAVAATEHSTLKGNGNTYKAFLIDPANGKLLVEKTIYDGTNDYMEFPAVFSGDGAYFKFAIRTSGLERRLHVALPWFFAIISMNKYAREINETREVNVITLNEKLEEASNVKLPLNTGTMVTWNANKQGDMFIAWLNGPTIEVYKYPDGSKAPVQQLNADVTFQVDNNAIASDMMRLLPSAINGNLVYYGVSYINTNSDAELGVGRFDFATNKKLFVAEGFDKDHVKTLQKGFVPVNKKVDDANLGRRDNLRLRYMAEVSGTLVTAVTARYTSSGMNGAWVTENSVLINGYNDDLSARFQLILPVNYTIPNKWLPLSFHPSKNKLYVVGNNKSGMTTLNGVYGSLDVTTGKWDKMDLLSKKKIDNSDYANGDAILWFADTYVVPYFSPKGLMQNKYDITLQQNNY